MIIYWRHNEKTDIDISGGIDADELCETVHEMDKGVISELEK